MLAIAGALTLEGNHDAAHPIGDAAVDTAGPRSFVGFIGAMAGKMRNLRMLGNIQEALTIGLETSAAYGPQDRRHVGFYCTMQCELAACESTLGRHEAAARRIDEYLEEIGERGGPAARGTLFEARAHVALAAGDLPTARAFSERTKLAFEPTAHPMLVARSERLQREIETAHAQKRLATEAPDLEEPTSKGGLRPV
jgi:hypothetical protein